MNKIRFDALIFSSLLAVTGCSKDVSKIDGRFAQTNPDPIPNECDPTRLDDLRTYSAFIQSDLELDEVSLFGRVASSNAWISKSTFGFLSTPDANRADLEAEGVLDVKSVSVPNGRATYGVSLSSKKSIALGGFNKVKLDLSSRYRKISEFSNACAGVKLNTTLTKTCTPTNPKVCTLEIKGSDPVLNIAEVSGAALADVHAYLVDIPVGAALVTNFSGLGSEKFEGVAAVFKNGSTIPDLFWNFPDAKQLEFLGTIFFGTILAPDADLDVQVSAKVIKGPTRFWVNRLKATDSVW